MPAQACGIRVSAAGAIWGMGKIYGFVEYLFDLGTSHAQISEGISKRQQGVGVADGDVTGRNVSADTSGILDGYIRVLAQKEERLSDKVGNVPAILGSGSGTAWKFAATLPGNTLKAEVFGCHTHHFIAERKSTRLNSSHVRISYAVFCLKKKNCIRHDARCARLGTPWQRPAHPA